MGNAGRSTIGCHQGLAADLLQLPGGRFVRMFRSGWLGRAFSVPWGAPDHFPDEKCYCSAYISTSATPVVLLTPLTIAV